MGLKPVCRTTNARRAAVEDMNIDHRRLDVAMTQELLYRSNLARYYFNRRLIDPRMRAPFRHFPVSLEGGLGGLPLRILLLPVTPLFSEAADIVSTARVWQGLTLHLHPARWLVWSPLRASRDRRIIAGPLRARRTVWLLPSHPSHLTQQTTRATIPLSGIVESAHTCYS